MAIPVCLALTAAEFTGCDLLPPFPGWMAAHFSSSSPGLTNMPTALPAGGVLMLDDSIPFQIHQPELIAEQLKTAATAMQLAAIILDFQRPATQELRTLAKFLSDSMPCCVIATQEYATEQMPVLLPPCPPNCPLENHIAPYKKRDIWLELSMEGLLMRITEKGAQTESMFPFKKPFPHKAAHLHCHYCIEKTSDAISFHFQRTSEDLHALLQQAEQLGVSHAIGLWQEVKDFL